MYILYGCNTSKFENCMAAGPACRGVCLNSVRLFKAPFWQRGSRCAAARGGLSMLSARFFCSLPVENGPLHDSTVSASAKARPTEGATLHARLRLGYRQHQVMAQESDDDWHSIRPPTELGEKFRRRKTIEPADTISKI